MMVSVQNLNKCYAIFFFCVRSSKVDTVQCANNQLYSCYRDAWYQIWAMFLQWLQYSVCVSLGYMFFSNFFDNGGDLEDSSSSHIGISTRTRVVIWWYCILKDEELQYEEHYLLNPSSINRRITIPGMPISSILLAFLVFSKNPFCFTKFLNGEWTKFCSSSLTVIFILNYRLHFFVLGCTVFEFTGQNSPIPNDTVQFLVGVAQSRSISNSKFGLDNITIHHPRALHVIQNILSLHE